MLFYKPALLATVLALFAGVSAAPVSGTELEARVGPSGSVIFPPGNTKFVNLGGTGDLHIQYQRVNQTLSGNRGPAWTVGVDLFLEDPTGRQASFPICSDLRANPINAAVIDAHFVPPVGACGTYNLVFQEHQFYLGQVISFRAAAPYVSITCGPIQ
ncbi:hypothetical protein DACRYDRAFT_100394 [Dacryopinax primogenitus]|uniref:Uncharacterized protein n=1 Tax=Dacryopinax primogenitus (strain DJM 731) TaxID=1858805 RepID=M5FY66_DACPD|nr:uncharacterized protein DACRYDRAFT_100394 [Dacryopinax primogenitus]EJU01479.1 hypothetical protein DACRYDRAFT_100394 [Dacryopinax primogenitus]